MSTAKDRLKCKVNRTSVNYRSWLENDRKWRKNENDPIFFFRIRHSYSKKNFFFYFARKLIFKWFTYVRMQPYWFNVFYFVFILIRRGRSGFLIFFFFCSPVRFKRKLRAGPGHITREIRSEYGSDCSSKRRFPRSFRPAEKPVSLVVIATASAAVSTGRGTVGGGQNENK